MTKKQFLSRVDKIKSKYSKARLTSNVVVLKECLKQAKDLMHDIETVKFFDGVEEKIKLENIVYKKSVDAILDPKTEIANLQIAYYLYNNSDVALVALENEVADAKQNISGIIDGLEVLLENQETKKS